MSPAQALTGPIAANNIHKWMRAWHQGSAPDAIDLDLVRQMLPDTPYGQGVREIKAPIAHGLASCEGMLARNPHDDAVAVSVHVYQAPLMQCARFRHDGDDWYVREQSCLTTDATD